MDRLSLLKRSIIGLAAAALLFGSAAPVAAGPEDELLALLMRADNVQATGIGPTSIFVSWHDHSPIETAYRIEIATDEAGPYAQAAIAPACATGIGQLSVDPLGFTSVCWTQIQVSPAADPAPRFVRVVPLIQINGSTILEGLASDPDPALLGPLPPTDLLCNGGGDTACLNVASVTLSWQDNSDEAEFWIMRARAAFDPQFGTSPHAIVPANTTTYSEYLTDFLSTYYYRVVAVRRQNIARLDGSITVEQSFSNSLSGGGQSGGGPIDRVKVETPPVPPPTDPGGLTAVFIPPSTAKLTWSDPGNVALSYVDEDGWFIDWGPSATNFRFTTTKLPKVGQGTVTFTDPNIPQDTTRCFRVRGWRNGPAYSGFTNVACIGSTPLKPTGLTATALDNATVNLAWNDNSDAETGFVIQRCDGVCGSGGSWTDIGSAPVDAQAYTDATTLATTAYSYRVFAENSSGRSAASNIATVTTPVALVAKPTNLVATATGSHQITLAWIDNATNETGFRIEFKRDGDWSTLAEIGQRTGTGSVSYVDDADLAANEQRCYRVRSLKVNKMSDPSNVDCATTLPPAIPNGVPTGLTASPASNYRIDLTWMDNATNEDAFRVETIAFPNLTCPQNPTGLTFKKVATAPARTATGSTSYAVEGLQPHTAYFFRVIAVNKDGETGPSNVTTCAETFGPPLPVFLNPEKDGDVEATRCYVDVKAPAATVDRVKLIVNAYVPQTNVGDAQVIYEESPQSGDTWRFNYQFRRGVTYRLIAQSFGFPANRYASATAELRDIKVLADCPVQPDPLP